MTDQFAGYLQEGQYFIQLWTAHLILEYGKPSDKLKSECLEVIIDYADNPLAPDASIEEKLWVDNYYKSESRKGFEEKYPELYQFISGYFSDWYDLPDEQYAQQYLKDVSKDQIDKAKKELEDVLLNLKRYWKNVGDEANRYFKNEADALEWLNMVKVELHR